MNPQLLHDVPTPVREVAESRSLEAGSPEATELEELLFNIQTKGILSEAGTLNTATAIAAIKLLGPITTGTDKRLWYYKDGYWKFRLQLVPTQSLHLQLCFLQVRAQTTLSPMPQVH